MASNGTHVNSAKARGPSRLLPSHAFATGKRTLQTGLASRIELQRSPDSAQRHRSENPKCRKRGPLGPKRADKRRPKAATCRESGVRLKWGDKLENGKGVVADASPPRTMPSQITTPQTASHAPLYAILAYSSIILFNATRRAEQMHRASDRMLCHNMCRPIRVIQEIDVELTFDGERESTRALHLTGLLAYSRVPPLTYQYIYVKCT